MMFNNTIRLFQTAIMYTLCFRLFCYKELKMSPRNKRKAKDTKKNEV